MTTVKNLYEGSVRLGKKTRTEAERCLSMLTPTVNFGDLKSVDLVSTDNESLLPSKL